MIPRTSLFRNACAPSTLMNAALTITLSARTALRIAAEPSLVSCSRARGERREGRKMGANMRAPPHVHTSAHTLKHTHTHTHQVSCLHALTTVRISRQICELSTPPPTTTTVLHPGTCPCPRILQTALLLSASAIFLWIDRCAKGVRGLVCKGRCEKGVRGLRLLSLLS